MALAYPWITQILAGRSRTNNRRRRDRLALLLVHGVQKTFNLAKRVLVTRIATVRTAIFDQVALMLNAEASCLGEG